MTYSLGEVEALSRKAARGAGLSWGMSEEAGKAVRWLCSWGLPGAKALIWHLENLDGAVGPENPTLASWNARSGTLCPIVCGTLISDLADLETDKHLHGVASPLLLVPHVAWTTPQGCVSWQGGQISWAEQVHVAGVMLTPLAETVTLSASPKPGGTVCQRTWRADLDKTTLERLNRFAAKTYAPETEASKVSGAGAGLKDED